MCVWGGGGGENSTEESRTPWNFPKLRRFWYFFLLARRVLTYIISEYLILFVNFMLGQTPKKNIFYLPRSQEISQISKNGPKFRGFWGFFTSNDLRIHLYNFWMLNFRWIFYALSNNKKKFRKSPSPKKSSFWGKPTKFSHFLGVFPHNVQKNWTFVSKLVFSHEKSAL